MKILCVLLLVCVALTAVEGDRKKGRTCEGKKMGAMEQFNTRGIDVMIPCKYPAIKRQRCGKYLISLTPGNIWLGTNYYWNTLWLSVNDTETNEAWDGKTTNKVIVKYYNSRGSRPMFNKGQETPFGADKFDIGLEKSKKGDLIPVAYIKDKDEIFQVTIEAWDPDNRKFPHSSWKFECFDESMQLHEYPYQICGGDNLKVEDYAKRFGLQSNHKNLMVYYDTFTSDVHQVDEECSEAATILKNCGDDARKIVVLENCGEILARKMHTECITYYQCTPMQSFNACLRWGCAGKKPFDRKENDLCYSVGEAIDLCGNITGAGNLTDRMKEARCYKEYLEITFDGTSPFEADFTGEDTQDVQADDKGENTQDVQADNKGENTQDVQADDKGENTQDVQVDKGENTQDLPDAQNLLDGR